MLSEYLEVVLDYGRKNSNRMIQKLLKAMRKIKFDAIAFRGVSGSLMAPILAYKLKKGLIVVRKGNESTHSSYVVEGTIDNRHTKYVIVDDLILTGETIENIMSEIDKEVDNHFFVDGRMKCVGVFLYAQNKMGLKKSGMSDEDLEKLSKKVPIFALGL